MVLRDGDYLQDIVSYIEKNQNIRYKGDELRFMLIRRGYSRSAIEKAFRVVEQKRQETKPIQNIQPPKVVVIDSSKDEQEKPKGSRFFSKIKSFLTVKSRPKKHKLEGDETIQIDAQGNLVR